MSINDISRETKSSDIKIIICLLIIIAFLLSIKEFLFLYILMFIEVIYIIYSYNINKHFINELNKDKKIEQELQNIKLYIKNQYILTESYLINIYNRKVFRYEDILMYYYKINLGRTTFKRGPGIYIYVITKNGISKFKNENNHFYEILEEKCKTTLKDNTKENRKNLLEKHNTKLSFSGRFIITRKS